MTLRITVFGQAAFARDVTLGLVEAGHEIAAVYQDVGDDTGRRAAELDEGVGLDDAIEELLRLGHRFARCREDGERRCEKNRTAHTSESKSHDCISTNQVSTLRSRTLPTRLPIPPPLASWPELRRNLCR